MTLALVLSGGGARGDFEVGAVECIYERGLRPDILVGTSVGAINATKLAEGEGGPDQGLQGLKKIWLSLLWNSDMWKPEAWIKQIDPVLANALIDGTMPNIGGPASFPPPPAAGWPGELAYGLNNFILGLSWLVTDGRALLTAIDKFISSRALFNLDPIRAKIQAGGFDETKVQAWAASGKKLRLATVNLETGLLRYVTETGTVVESDHITPVQFVQGTTPQVQGLEADIAAVKDEIAGLQEDLRTAAPGAKPGLVGQIRTLQARLASLTTQLNNAKKQLPLVPLRVNVAEGAIASSSIAVVFPPARLGDGSYIDGGHRDILPLKAALDLGAARVIAVQASPPKLDSPTLENPAPQPKSYAGATVITIGARALIDVPLDEILHNELTPPANWSGNYNLVAPTIGIHEMLTIDPGLIRINMDYGYMRAADILDGIDNRSATAQDADQIALLRAQQWRKECQLFGRPIPTAPDDDPGAPQPARLGELRDLAASVKLIVNRRRTSGRPLPARAVRWGQTWELHPWLIETEAPVTAIVPRTDELLVAGITNEGKENGRLMFAHWAPASGWRGWLPIEFGYGGSQSFIGTGTEVDHRNSYVFWIGTDGWVYYRARKDDGQWQPTWIVGNSAAPNLQGVPGGAVHGVSCQQGIFHIFYTNTQGRILFARRDTAGGGTWPEHAGLSGGVTAPGGHVTAVSCRPGQLDVFCVGTNGGIYTASWSVGGTWSPWSQIGNTLARVGNYVGAVSRNRDKIDIFVVDTQGRTMSAAWEPGQGWQGWWHIQNGMAGPTGFVTCVSRNLDLLDIFTRGADGYVYTAAWSPSGGWGGWWRINDARTIGPVWPLSRSQDKLDIFFAAPDGTVQTAAWPVSGNWGGPWLINDRWELRE